MRADLLAEKFVCLQTKIRLNAKINRFARFYLTLHFCMMVFACRNEVAILAKQAKRHKDSF